MKQPSAVNRQVALAMLGGTAVAFPGMRTGVERIVKDSTLELRACPFCGKKAHLMAEDTVGGPAWTVRCGYCLCQSPSRYVKQAAIRRWQRRKI